MSHLNFGYEYTREDIHSIFSPSTKFTPSTGTWGLHGIVPVPNTNKDYERRVG